MLQPGDAHLTAAGYELIGGQMADSIRDAIRSRRRRFTCRRAGRLAHDTTVR